MAGQMMSLLEKLAEKVIGQLPYDPELVSAALAGRPLDRLAAREQVREIVQRLERIASERARHRPRGVR
jgi:CO dehydrogenase nickel-insertion accessory protein CooC1